MTITDPKLAVLAKQALRARELYFEAEGKRQTVAFLLPMGRYDALSFHPEVTTNARTAYRAWVRSELALARYLARVKR